MDETLKPVVAQFLLEFKKLAQSALIVWPRDVNTQALLVMGLTFADRICVILSLSVEDYSSGPLRDLNRAGDVWIFGKEVHGLEVYIKLKLVEYRSTGTNAIVSQAVCISFHPTREPLDYPFK